MRTILKIGLTGLIGFLGACTPEIVGGSYECGPEEACPDGQACDGPTAVCVSESTAQPFACGEDTNEIEPNNTQATASPSSFAQCVSPVAEFIGCQNTGIDTDDWYAVGAPEVCSQVHVELRLSYAVAYGALSLELRDPSGVTVATASTCNGSSATDGNVDVCLTAPLVPGQTFAAHVTGSGIDDCDGACAYNRYRLSLQLASP